MATNDSSLAANQRRRFMRFPPDPMDVAYVDFEMGETFKPGYVALIRQEAYAGCGLLLIYEDKLEEVFARGRRCMIKVGKLDPLPAEVVWSTPIEEEALKVGFKFDD